MHHVITHHISKTLANYHFEKSYLQLFIFVICQLPQHVKHFFTLRKYFQADQSTTLGATSAVGVAACWPRAPPTSTAASCTAAAATPSRPDRPAPPSPPPTPPGSPPNRSTSNGLILPVMSVPKQIVACLDGRMYP